MQVIFELMQCPDSNRRFKSQKYSLSNNLDDRMEGGILVSWPINLLAPVLLQSRARYGYY